MFSKEPKLPATCKISFLPTSNSLDLLHTSGSGPSYTSASEWVSEAFADNASSIVFKQNSFLSLMF